MSCLLVLLLLMLFAFIKLWALKTLKTFSYPVIISFILLRNWEQIYQNAVYVHFNFSSVSGKCFRLLPALLLLLLPGPDNRRQDSVRDVRQIQYMYYILCSYRNTAATHHGSGTRQGEVFKGPYRHMLTSPVINIRCAVKCRGWITKTRLENCISKT